MIIQLHEVASDFKNLETISLWRPFIFRDHSLLETHLLLKTIQFWDSFPQVYFLETISSLFFGDHSECTYRLSFFLETKLSGLKFF